MKTINMQSVVVRRWFDGLGASARMKYGQALRKFTTWATGVTNPKPRDALRLLVDAGRIGAHRLVRAWRDSLLDDGKSSSTVNGMVTALASLVTAARLCGLVEWHLEKIAPKIEPRLDRRGPPMSEMEILMASITKLARLGDHRAIRDAAIVRLLHNCAIDRGAIAAMRLQDVDLHHADGPQVLALRKKSAERHPIKLGENTAESLAAWLQVRGDHPGPVFQRVRGLQDASTAGPLSGEAIRLMLRQRARQAGCRATIRPSGPRKTVLKEAEAMAAQFQREACEL